MPRQDDTVHRHRRHCHCRACQGEWAAYWEQVRELDRLAAADPEPQARAEFAAWVEQAPPTTEPKEAP